MQRNLQAAALSTLALLPVLSHATSAFADAAMECSAQVPTQVEVASCVNEQLRIADLALEQALEFARDSATELDSITGRVDAIPALEKSQAAWIGYRNAECEYREALYAGGSGGGIAKVSCMVGLTRERLTEVMASLQ